jgi:membrane protein implicated in regulation of membrane protease activity
MLNALWSSALADPWLAFLVLLAVAFALAWLVTLLEVRKEARRTRPSTIAELRKDAYEAERQERLRVLQGGRDHDRQAS